MSGISSWSEYKNWVETVIGAKKDYYYRGQSNSSWKLQTTFHRYAPEVGMTLEQYLDYVLPEVHHYVSAQYNELLNLQNPEEFGAFLALLQHHGFPTPLLDWTLSPYIAAYFAFRDVDIKEPKTDYVRIYIFDYKEWISSFEQPLNLRDLSKAYVSVIRTHAKYNPRLIPQMGRYTVTNVADIESHLLTLSAQQNKTFLYIVDLPVSERIKVMRDLNLMGINEMTLFPGMDGICRTLKEQFFCPDIVGLSPAGRSLLAELLGANKKKSNSNT